LKDSTSALFFQKENGWANPRAYELAPVAFYTKNGEVK
jgi:hypothetical protein